MNGTLGDKLVPDLIREIAVKKASGLLRLTRGKTIKAIFFENGTPIFAISNQANEQLEFHISQKRLADTGQLEEAKQKAGKLARLGSTLVEMGLIGQEDMEAATRETAKKIILSAFAWTQGDYAFDERVRAAHEVKLGWGAADCLLEGARNAASSGEFINAIVRDDAVLVQPESYSKIGSTGRLNSSESYVLSMVQSGTQVKEVSTVTGLSEQEVRSAVCSLLSLGLLRTDDTSEDDDLSESSAPADDSIAQLRLEISRKIHFFATADYYEILGVPRRATPAEIKTAYYGLAKKFHPDRFRQPEYEEIRLKLEALFAKITQAYETLSDRVERANYDDRLKKPGKGGVPEGRPLVTEALRTIPVETMTPLSVKKEPSEPVDSGSISANERTEDSPVESNSAASPSGPAKAPPNAGQNAEYYYRQGRARFDQKDYYGAVQFLREAVKLDSGKAPYHFHLGMALLRNPRTRREGEIHLVKAAELDPFSTQIRLRLAMIYKEGGLPKKAEYYFKEVLSLDPDNKIAIRELGGAGSAGDKKEDASIWKSDLGSIAKKLFKR